MTTLKDITTVGSLPDSHFLALSKYFASQAKKNSRRESVDEGDHTMSGVLEYSFGAQVAADIPDAIIAAKVPVWDVLAAALGRLNGVTVAALLRDVEEGNYDAKSAKSKVTEAFKKLKNETRGLKRGRVTITNIMLGE